MSGTVNAASELIAVLSSRARAVSVASTSSHSGSSWNTEVELVAMVVSSAIRISCAFHTITLNRCTIDATLELIAVLAGGA